MGILNAIFAPFIVLYLLMYSFFRYFEVGMRSPLPFDNGLIPSPRNTTKTRHPSEVDSTPLMRSGSSESSTSSRISSEDASTNRTR